MELVCVSVCQGGRGEGGVSGVGQHNVKRECVPPACPSVAARGCLRRLNVWLTGHVVQHSWGGGMAPRAVAVEVLGQATVRQGLSSARVGCSAAASGGSQWTMKGFRSKNQAQTAGGRRLSAAAHLGSVGAPPLWPSLRVDRVQEL